MVRSSLFSLTKTVRSPKKRPDHMRSSPNFFGDHETVQSRIFRQDRSTVQSQIFWGPYNGPVPKIGTGLFTNQSGPVRSRSHSLVPKFFRDCTTVQSRISRPDRIIVESGPDHRTILRSGPKVWDRTALKSVRSSPVPVPRSGPVSLFAINVETEN